jgi:hypothetical protein
MATSNHIQFDYERLQSLVGAKFYDQLKVERSDKAEVQGISFERARLSIRLFSGSKKTI